MSTDDLLRYLFDGQPHLLAEPVHSWITSSRRFGTFTVAFQDKIRKRIRVTRDRESLLDLRLELETAFLLLRERSLSLMYEPEPLGQGRSLDFAVTFTTRLTFLLEVKRLRAGRAAGSEAEPVGRQSDPVERLADAICSKLGQLRAQRGNVLVVGIDGRHPDSSELRAAALRLQQRAEREDRAFLERHRLRDRAGFFQNYRRLSEVLARGIPLPAGEPPAVWVNPQAKHPLPAEVHATLVRGLGG